MCITLTWKRKLIRPNRSTTKNTVQLAGFLQLQEFGDGFLKNEIVPMDELSQQNQFQPLK